MKPKKETATKEATGAVEKTTAKKERAIVRLRCTRKCQVEGIGIVAVGEMIELPEDRVDARIHLCFDVDKPADVSAEKVVAEKPVRKPGGGELTVDQLKSKLEDLRVYVPRNATKEMLEEILAGATAGTADFLGK